METIKINIADIKNKEIDLIANYFKKGKVIAYPTDTIYGLGCAAADEQAIKRIYQIKQITAPRPYIILVSSLAMLKKYAYIKQKKIAYLNKVWPGPVTVVLKSRNNLPANILGPDKSIAARLPKNDFLIKIIKGLGKPIVSTSLNLSGQPNLTDLNKIKAYFKDNKPDLAINAGSLPKRRPSKIIDLRGDLPETLRP